MNGKRVKQIRRATGLNAKLYRSVQALAMADGAPEEIYMAEPQDNSRLWDGKGKRRDPLGNILHATRKGKKHKYTPPEILVEGEDGPEPASTQMFTVRHIPQLPRRHYLNVKRQYVKLVSQGRRGEAIQALEDRDMLYTQQNNA